MIVLYGIDFPGLGVPINIPTRGWSPDFQQIGVLANDKDNRILPLFGRQMNNGGNKWWYYTMSDQNTLTFFTEARTMPASSGGPSVAFLASR